MVAGSMIQPKHGGKLNDCRCDVAPYLGTLPGDDCERLLIWWSHQASASDRHNCVAPASAFVVVTP